MCIRDSFHAVQHITLLHGIKVYLRAARAVGWDAHYRMMADAARGGHGHAPGTRMTLRPAGVDTRRRSDGLGEDLEALEDGRRPQPLVQAHEVPASGHLPGP